MWVLFIISLNTSLAGGQAFASSNTASAEFNTQAACESAGEAVKERIDLSISLVGATGVTTYLCQKK